VNILTVYEASPYMVPAYWIPGFWVPALLVTHYIAFVVLLKYWRSRSNDQAPASGKLL
jgi:hypothetical protein